MYFHVFYVFYVFYGQGMSLGSVGWSFARLGEQQVAWREREIGNSIEDLQGFFYKGACL